MISIENKSGQGMAITANIGERKRGDDGEFHWDRSVEIKFSRGIAVASYNAVVEAWNAATPEQRKSLTDPSTMIDPYTDAVPVALIRLDDVAKEHKVEPAVLLAALRRSAYFRACERDGRLIVVGAK